MPLISSSSVYLSCFKSHAFALYVIALPSISLSCLSSHCPLCIALLVSHICIFLLCLITFPSLSPHLAYLCVDCHCFVFLIYFIFNLFSFFRISLLYFAFSYSQFSRVHECLVCSAKYLVFKKYSNKNSACLVPSTQL